MRAAVQGRRRGLAAEAPAAPLVHRSVWWAVVAVPVLGGVVAAYFTAYSTFWARSPDGQAHQAELDLARAVDDGRCHLYSATLAAFDVHIDAPTGFVVRRYPEPECAGCIVYSEDPPYVLEWNRLLRDRWARGERCGPTFPDRLTALEDARALFRVPSSRAQPLDAVIGGHYVHGVQGGVQLFAGPAPEGDPVGRLVLWVGDGDFREMDGLTASALLADGDRTLWVRYTRPDGADRWYLAMDVATGMPMCVYDLRPE